MNVEHRTSNFERRVSSIGYRASRSGFSLMEVLIAVGTLALGMLFIASVFPAGVYWTTVASERTISAVAAEDAFATIKLYGLYDANWVAGGQTPLEAVSPISSYSYEYAYPSDGVNLNLKKYWWSAICRKIDTNDVQVTVFVSRKVGTGTTYRTRAPIIGLSATTISGIGRPVSIPVIVSAAPSGRMDELLINDNLPVDNILEKTFINDGSTIVDDTAGHLYRVLERYPGNDSIIHLDKDWQGGALPGIVWVVPPPVGGGRYPCIAVYQKVMRF
jgi:Tfp pilus assembly protein PilV